MICGVYCIGKTKRVRNERSPDKALMRDHVRSTSPLGRWDPDTVSRTKSLTVEHLHFGCDGSDLFVGMDGMDGMFV